MGSRSIFLNFEMLRLMEAFVGLNWIIMDCEVFESIGVKLQKFLKKLSFQSASPAKLDFNHNKDKLIPIDGGLP
jgi:hypothetical protein